MDIKKTKKYRVVIDDQYKNVVCNLNWQRYLFDFDARYGNLNLIFVFDSSTKTLLTSYIFIKLVCVQKKGNGVVIGNYEAQCFLPVQKNLKMVRS